jgi:hypothetical protein
LSHLATFDHLRKQNRSQSLLAALVTVLISGAKNNNSPCKKREGLAEKRLKIPLVRRREP